MNRKTLILVALVAGLATLPLFANGQKEQSSGAMSGAITKSTSGTITVWHYFSLPPQVQALTDLAALYNKNMPNVKINYVYVPYDQLPNKIVAAAAANSGPDVVVYNGPDVGQFVDSKAIINLDPYWGKFADSDLFAPAVIHKIDGHVYGVQGYVNLLGLWYNKNILEKLGIAPPKTIDELNADLAKAKAAGFTGITLTGKPNDQGEWQAEPWLSAYGWSYSNPSVSALEKGYGLVSSWAQAGYLSRIVVTWGQAAPFQAFTVGNVAFAENGNWQIADAKAHAKFDYGIVPMPAGSESAKVYLGGEAESVGAFSKDPALAWDYLMHTYFSKAGQLICFRDVGSIPSRKDAAADPVVTSDALLAPFAQEVQEQGAVYPPDAGPTVKVQNAQLKVAQSWSAVIAGQVTPASGAQTAVAGVKDALGQ